MATETRSESTSAPAPTANEQQVEQFTQLAREGKSICVGEFVGEDGKLYEMHVFAKDSSGDWAPLEDELDRSNPRVQKLLRDVDQLAKETLNVHKDSPATRKPTPHTEGFIINQGGIHYAKKDDSHGDTTVKHEVTHFKSEHHVPFETAAVGGVTDHLSGDQRQILTFGELPPSTSARELRARLKALGDRRFADLYTKAKGRMGTATHEQIFKAALREYVVQTSERYQYSVDPSERERLVKDINTAAHTFYETDAGRAAPEEPQEDWIASQDTSNVAVATAIFKGANEVARTHRTAHHTFSALVEKINDAWEERPDRLDSSSLTVAALPRGSTSVSPGIIGSGGSHRRRVFPSDESLQAYHAITTSRLYEQESKLHEVERKLTAANARIVEIDRTCPWPTNLRRRGERLQLLAERASITDVIPEAERATRATELGISVEALMNRNIPYLTAQKEDLEEDIEKLEDLNFTNRLEHIQALDRLIEEKDTQLSEVDRASWTWSDMGLALLRSTRFFDWSCQKATRKIEEEKGKLVQLRDAIFEDLRERTNVYHWDSTTEGDAAVIRYKANAVYTRLQLFNARSHTDVIEPDYQGALDKLNLATRDQAVDFTDQELKAISEWPVSTTHTTHEPWLNDLLDFLTTHAGATRPEPSALPPYHDRAFQMQKMEEALRGVNSRHADYAANIADRERMLDALQILTTPPYFFVERDATDRATVAVKHVLHHINEGVSSSLRGADRYVAICERLTAEVQSSQMPALTDLMAPVDPNAADYLALIPTAEHVQEALVLLTSVNPSYDSISNALRWTIHRAFSRPNVALEAHQSEKYQKVLYNLRDEKHRLQEADLVDLATIPSGDGTLYRAWRNAPLAAHFAGAREWALGNKPTLGADGLTEEETFALKLIDDQAQGLPSATERQNKRAELLEAHRILAATREETAAIRTDQEPYTTWNQRPPRKHFEDAFAWINGDRAPLSDGAKNALKSVEVTNDALSATQKFERMRMALEARTHAARAGRATPSGETTAPDARWEAIEREHARRAFTDERQEQLLRAYLSPDQRDLYRRILPKYETTPMNVGGLEDLELYTLNMHMEHLNEYNPVEPLTPSAKARALSAILTSRATAS